MFQIIGRLIFVGSIVLIGYAYPLTSHAADETTATVIFSEVNWAGSSLSTADEWIELTNLTDESIDLSGWTIQSAASSSGTLTIPEGSVIEPNSTFLISNYDELNSKSTLAHTPDYITTEISLSNSGLLLVLIDGTGQRRDSALDGSKPLAGRVGTNGGGSDGEGFASMVRTAPVEDGTLTTSWMDATKSDGFDEGVSDLGSPGVTEGWEIPPTEIEEILMLEEIQILEEITVAEEIIDEKEIMEIEEIPATVDINEISDLVEESEMNDPSESESNPETEQEIASPALREGRDRNDEMEETEDENEIIQSTYPVGTLIINEFVSDADEEWVEIFNPYNNVIPLSGWTIRDGSRKQTGLPDQLLGMEQYVVIKNPLGKLNNTGDTIELLDPTGATIDSVVYGTDTIPIPKNPYSLARDADGEWVVTVSVTMGTENEIVTVQEKKSIEVKKVKKIRVVKEEKKSIPDTVENKKDISEEITEIKEEITTVRLSEIYPNTTGSDLVEEFIELENYGEETVCLSGWKLMDAGEKIYWFEKTLCIPPHQYLTITRAESNIALNNTSDTVSLLSPDESLIDTQSYETPKKGYAYIFVGTNEWDWTSNPSPDEPNVVSSDESDGSTRVATASSRRRSIKAYASDVEGIVAVSPGVLGKQIFYILKEDGVLQIYKHDGDFPELEVGDRVSITGSYTENRGEKRLKVSSENMITVTGWDVLMDPERTDIASLSMSEHGPIITVSGVVASRTGKKVLLEDSGSQLTIRVAEGTGIDAAVFARGAHVEVTGLLIETKDAVTLLPRSSEDVSVIPTFIAESTISTPTGKESRAASDKSIAFFITLLTILGLAIYFAFNLIPKWKRLYAKHRALRTTPQATR